MDNIKHRGYNNDSGLIYKYQCGMSQYQGKIKYEKNDLPEPDYENAENVNKLITSMNNDVKQPKINEDGNLTLKYEVDVGTKLITSAKVDSVNDDEMDIPSTSVKLDIPEKYKKKKLTKKQLKKEIESYK
mgnify:FL=1